MRNVYVTSHSSISSLGAGLEESNNSLKSFKDTIKFPEADDKFNLPYFPVNFNDDNYKDELRSSRIALNLMDLIKNDFIKCAPLDIFLATSTGGIRETEEHYYAITNNNEKYPLFKKHYLNCIADDIKKYYGNNINIMFTISTACSSSGQSLIKAYDLIKNGIIDNALIIGVDSLSFTTIKGFDSLKLVSHTRTKPLTVERDGLTLGEGGGIVFLQANPDKKPIAEIIGGYSSSDGYHISSPDPEGIGQFKCIKKAIEISEIKNEDIDFISAHGTGTVMNDEVELKVLKKIFNNKIPVVSLKGLIGHTLGASAILELSLVLRMIKDNAIYNKIDKYTPLDTDYVPASNINKKIKYFIKNSFGFGGNNTCIVLKNIDN